MTLNSLKKIIKYRSNYSGTKETDLLYKKYFINNINKFSKKELKLLNSVFDIYSDNEIYDILTNKIEVKIEFKNLFEKILKFK
jgi:succinate dehydrogenase flavin-adding protein (antitoxin of CptAB toxin-antitoxin module)